MLWNFGNKFTPFELLSDQQNVIIVVLWSSRIWPGRRDMRDVSGLNAGSYAIFAFINGLSFSETNTDFILYGDDTTTLNHGRDLG